MGQFRCIRNDWLTDWHVHKNQRLLEPFRKWEMKVGEATEISSQGGRHHMFLMSFWFSNTTQVEEVPKDEACATGLLSLMTFFISPKTQVPRSTKKKKKKKLTWTVIQLLVHTSMFKTTSKCHWSPWGQSDWEVGQIAPFC